MEDKFYWLFLYDIFDEQLNVLFWGTKEEVLAHINEKLSRVPYFRQWIEDGMQVIDYGSHSHYLKIYPILEEA